MHLLRAGWIHPHHAQEQIRTNRVVHAYRQIDEAHTTAAAKDVAGAVNDAARDITGAARDTCQALSSKVEEGVGRTKEYAQHAVDATKDAAQRATDTAKEIYQSASARAEDALVSSKEYVRQNPFPVALGTLIAGLAIGCMIGMGHREESMCRRRFF
jgi:ElaB/YqjD/DUF883 family membrane-anchored ribosome-binding protein